MKTLFFYIAMMITVAVAGDVRAQEARKVSLTLAEAIGTAQMQSPDARSAVHTLRAAYWNYRYFKANYLPSVTLVSEPYLNRQINKITQPDGKEVFLQQNTLNTDLTLQVSQNVWFTGGNLFLQSTLRRADDLVDGASSYNAQPFSIGYSQSFFGYNSLKWDRRIEPVRWREAKKSYAETMELIASRTCSYFYALASAQTNLDIARSNYAYADTLYMIACGRYNIGSITENEMLQLEVNKLNEETNVTSAEIEVEDAMLTLRSFLGYESDVQIEVVPSDSIVPFSVPLDEALKQAYANSPDPDNCERILIESRSNLASAKASRGLKADLYVQFGLSQTADNFRDSYRDPLDNQYVSLSLALPILDWGRGRGRVRVARSQMELVETQVGQAMTDFELNVRKMVRQFNLQARQVEVAAKTDRTARRRYEVAMKMYLAGKSTVLDLNAATSEKDSARRGYISAMQNYWTLYYGLRSMTQYDFRRGCSLEHELDIEKIVE